MTVGDEAITLGYPPFMGEVNVSGLAMGLGDGEVRRERSVAAVRSGAHPSGPGQSLPLGHPLRQRGDLSLQLGAPVCCVGLPALDVPWPAGAVSRCGRFASPVARFTSSRRSPSVSIAVRMAVASRHAARDGVTECLRLVPPSAAYRQVMDVIQGLSGKRSS